MSLQIAWVYWYFRSLDWESWLCHQSRESLTCCSNRSLDEWFFVYWCNCNTKPIVTILTARWTSSKEVCCMWMEKIYRGVVCLPVLCWTGFMLSSLLLCTICYAYISLHFFFCFYSCHVKTWGLKKERAFTWRGCINNYLVHFNCSYTMFYHYYYVAVHPLTV